MAEMSKRFHDEGGELYVLAGLTDTPPVDAPRAPRGS
jgi:hypothetical protein